jgi:hypothetical protein
MAALALAAVPAALASPPGKLVKSATASGQFAVTSFSADVKHPRVLYGRAIGRINSANFVVSCSRGFTITSNSVSRTSAGTWRLPILSRADSCTVIASVGGSGKVGAELRLVR